MKMEIPMNIAMTATGTQIPIPTFAPVERLPGWPVLVAEGDNVPVEEGDDVPVEDSTKAVGKDWAVLVGTEVAGGVTVEAEASIAKSELCHQMGTASPYTDVVVANVVVDTFPRFQLLAPILVG